MFDALHFACRIIRVLLFCLQADHDREGNEAKWKLIAEVDKRVESFAKAEIWEYDKINFIALAHHRRNFSG